MNDEDPAREPDDGPDQDRVRALLADAGGEEPLPDDVARRLDDRLAALVAERRGDAPTTTGSPDPTVDDRDDRDELARRRRTRWTRGLVAAAALVVVTGIGVPVARQVTGGGGATSGAQSSPDGSVQQDQGKPPAAAPTSGSSLGRATPTLGTATFRRDVTALLARLGPLPSRAPAAATPSPVSPGATASAPSCTGGPRGADSVLRVPVRLDGHPAVLDVQASRDGTSLVRALACSGSPVLATTRVPS